MRKQLDFWQWAIDDDADGWPNAALLHLVPAPPVLGLCIGLNSLSGNLSE